VNAEPLLQRVARTLGRVKLEAVLIGNAAAALHGAPVTTLDFDFMFRKTPTNLRKLKAFAHDLHAMVMRPYYPASDLFRVVSDDDTGLQVDFLATIHGIRSFESLRSRAVQVAVGDAELAVASLADIVKSKRAAGRPKDYAVLTILEATLDETKASHARRSPGRARPRG
jgi:predicted nucleotidyltransferase